LPPILPMFSSSSCRQFCQSFPILPAANPVNVLHFYAANPVIVLLFLVPLILPMFSSFCYQHPFTPVEPKPVLPKNLYGWGWQGMGPRPSCQRDCQTKFGTPLNPRYDINPEVGDSLCQHATVISPPWLSSSLVSHLYQKSLYPSDISPIVEESPHVVAERVVLSQALWHPVDTWALGSR
jgi:hypothetical protein